MTFWEQIVGLWSARQRAGVLLLALALVGSGLAVGTVHPIVLCVVTAVLAAACALLWWDGDPVRPRRAATLLLLLACGLTAYTFLQAVPLPHGVVATLDPHSGDVWAHALSALREPGPSWHSLSLDPVATRIEGLRGIAYVLCFLAALRMSTKREGAQLLCGVLVVSAFVLAVVSLLHPAFGAQRVFGVYKPETAIDERHVSPLLNPNPLAAYLNVGICISLAAAISPRPPVPRPISTSLAVVLIATQLWVASRGGILAMVLGAALVVLMSRAAKSRTVKVSGLVAGAMAAAGAGMIVLASSKDAWNELAGTDVSKLTMYRQMLPLVWAHKWFGVGRGAFESSFPAYRYGHGHLVFTHPEHVVVQWASEWGIPVAMLGFAAVAWALRPRTVLARSHTILGAWAALAAAVVHNLVDLNSEVPAVMLAFVACAALVVGGSSSQGDGGPAFEWASQPRRVAVVGTLGAVAALLLTIPVLGKDLYSDRQNLRDLALGTADDGRFAEEARAAILRHPAEPYLPFTGTLRASREGSLDAVAWAAATIERAPVYGPVHMMLGRSLRRVSPAQARLEYRTAMSQAPELTGYVIREATALVGGYDDAMELVPDSSGDIVLTHLALAIAAKYPSTRALLDDELLRRDATALPPRIRNARADVAALENAEAWCDGSTQCRDAALASTKEVIERQHAQCEGYALRARARAAAGEAAAATQELSDAVQYLEDPAKCLVALVHIALEANLEPRLNDAVDRLARAPCATPEECATNLVTAGEAEAARHRLERALVLFRKAHERAPDDDSVLERVAGTTSRLGLHAESMDSYARLAKKHPEVERYKSLAEREHEALGLPRAHAFP